MKTTARAISSGLAIRPVAFTAKACANSSELCCSTFSRTPPCAPPGCPCRRRCPAPGRPAGLAQDPGLPGGPRPCRVIVRHAVPARARLRTGIRGGRASGRPPRRARFLVECTQSGPRAVPERGGSSAGLSSGLIIRRSWVRVPAAPLTWPGVSRFVSPSHADAGCVPGCGRRASPRSRCRCRKGPTASPRSRCRCRKGRRGSARTTWCASDDHHTECRPSGSYPVVASRSCSWHGLNTDRETTVP